MSTIYRDRYDDSKTTISSRTEPNVKKVTRYIIRDQDDDTRSTYSTRSRREPEEPRRVPEYVERDLTIRTTRKEESSSPRRDYYARDYRDDDDEREIVIRRTVETSKPEREERELTISKTEDRHDSPRREVASPREPYWERDRDLQHYTRTTDYYGQQPQTIIIRQDPIIIRERVRDDDYQLVRKSEVDEERSVARREEPRDEEYFYEKQVRERYDEDDRHDRSDRRSRREVSPGDSVSQVGRHRRRDQSYSSDDSMVYVRRVKEDYDSREASPDRKKNLAAGVIAGVGAAELLRSHRKKEGRETASGIGRVGRDVGAGAIGALAAEGIQRARSLHRERSRRRDSRDRDRDWSDDDRDDRHGRSRSRSRRRRSRSRSQSHSRLKTLGALGLGAAAVAAAATIASKRMSKKNEEGEKDRRRSRSRRRDGSVESLRSLENDPSADDARNPSHRNKRIAAAGAVGAAGAALIERARSKSAGGRDRSRSRSRIRQGLPIVAAGLGTAALAGLYETNKAKRESEKIQADQSREARDERHGHRDHHGRSHSRGRSDSEYYEQSRGGLPAPPNAYDPQFIEYGEGPMHGNNYGKDYYGRAPPQEPYYNSQEMVPASSTREIPREDRRRSRSRSHDRRDRSLSPGSDPGRQHSRDAIGMAGAAAAVGGIAAAQHEKRKQQDKKERRSRRREQERTYGDDPHEDGYYAQNYNVPTPPPASDPYASQFYGNTTSPLPPPPGSMPQYTTTGMPQGYQNSATPQPQVPVGASAYQPPPNNTFGAPQNFQAPNDPYSGQSFPPPNPPNTQGYEPAYGPFGQPRNRGPEEEVSSGPSFPQSQANDQNTSAHDGVNSSSDAKQRPPSINIVPPSGTDTNPSTASMPNLTIPPTYESNKDRSLNDTPTQEHTPDDHTYNELADTHTERHVQFAPNTESSDPKPAPSNQTTDTDRMSPDDRRQRRHRNETNRGYEASEDTDTSPADDPRSRAYDTRTDRDNSNTRNLSRSNSNRDRNRDRDRDRDRTRDRPRDGDRDRDQDHGDRDRDRNRDGRRSSRQKSSKDDQDDDNDSDATIELAPRFDDKGRKRPERGEDALADKFDDILAGKGAAGKVFGNFVDGLLGGEKGKSSERDRDRDRRRRD